MENIIVDRGLQKFVDVTKIMPDELDGARKVVKIELANDRVEIYVRKHAGQGGHDSKHIVLNRYLLLDDFFFEVLGLWQGDGGKHKGLYFGNTSSELLLIFLRFSDEGLGIDSERFNVTVNSPINLSEKEENAINRRWANELSIPLRNFTQVCPAPKSSMQYAQMYVNGIVLSELMNNLNKNLRDLILSDEMFSASYIRGVFAAEGQVAFKEWGTIAYVSITCGTLDDLDWYRRCLTTMCIETGTYQESTNKVPIYGRTNLEAFGKFRLHAMHPKKKADFELGMSKYQRRVEDGDIVEGRILEQLVSGPKTYDELSVALNKGRSTIQSHYIPH